MNPFSIVLAKLGIPDANSPSGIDAMALAVLQLGAQLDISMVAGANPVDSCISSLKTMGVCPNAVSMLEARLNSLRDQYAKGGN